MKLSKAELLTQHVLGEELYEKLVKAIVKAPTKSVVDIQEAHSALKIAPKSVVTFLMKELKDLKDGEAKNIKLPFEDNAMMLINKMTADVYNGHFTKDGKMIHEFQTVSIPQLSSHILSAFELYEPVSDETSHTEDRIKRLEDKIDQLFLLVSKQPSQTTVVVQTQAKPEKQTPKVVEKSAELEKSQKQLNHLRIKKKLKKAGLMPKPPRPARPGVRAGSMKGVTQAGFHGDKTAASDMNTKPVTEVKNAYLKVQKSEFELECQDCHQHTTKCLCFPTLSKPELFKTESESWTLKLNPEWDKLSIEALVLSLKRK